MSKRTRDMRIIKATGRQPGEIHALLVDDKIFENPTEIEDKEDVAGTRTRDSSP